MNPSCKGLTGEHMKSIYVNAKNHTGSNGVQNAHVSVLTAHVSVLRGRNCYRAKSCVFKGDFETGRI